jgi:hypothetical protein
MISSGFRAERSSSMSVRHRALNSPRAVFFMDRLEHTGSHAYDY